MHLKTTLLVAAATLALAGVAKADVVTPSSLGNWAPDNVRADASVAITGTYKPTGENGSLEFNSHTVTPGQDKADFVNYAVNGTLGDLINQGALSYDYFVDSSSTTAAHLAPALRLTFLDDATSKAGYLIYEPVYNGVSDVTNDAWVHNDVLGANFWMRTFSPGFTVEQYGVTLADWASGVSFAGSYQLSGNTRIIGIETGIGSGWNNDFNGAVDHVLLDFGTGSGGVNANFEPDAVPEPGTWALMIAGFGGAGAMLRRRRQILATAA